jgi:hypothetical protein
MSSKKAQTKPLNSNSRRAAQPTAVSPSHHPTVSARWLAGAVSLSLAAAGFCGWGVLCLIFWQGGWQLLYHPTSAMVSTPARIGIPFDSIEFAPNVSGIPQLHGWWIPCEPSARYTVIYLHGASGNMGNSLDAFIPIRAAHVNIFTFDYRGYGTSHFEHPSEERWRQDAESALQYLTDTRHIPQRSIVLAGKDLGADLALEMAAEHPDLAGVILDNPILDPTSAIFDDPRAGLVPAHLLVSDRWDTTKPAANLRIPSLWLFNPESTPRDRAADGQLFNEVNAPRMDVWSRSQSRDETEFANALARWLDGLSPKSP